MPDYAMMLLKIADVKIIQTYHVYVMLKPLVPPIETG